eukprot:jgi/Hompol1/459/HPOL_000559-RA
MAIEQLCQALVTVGEQLSKLMAAEAQKAGKAKEETRAAVQATIADLTQQANTLFAELLHINRSGIGEIKSKREAAIAVRNAMDKTHLTLQNYNYERQYYMNEIEKCKSFQTVYQDIPLHSIEEFMALAGPELTKPEDIADEHKLMINRLKFELAERIRVAKTLEELKARKAAMVALNKALSDELETIDKDISEFLKSTIPLQKKYGIKISKRREIAENSMLLSAPLFILYKHFIGYIDSQKESGRLTVEVLDGREEEGETSVQSTDISRIPGTGARTLHDNSSDADMTEADFESLYEHHPYKVTLSIKDIATLTFSYIPALQIVVVNATLAKMTEYSPASLLISGLFAGDDGTISPNPSNSFLSEGTFVFDPVKAKGP